ncbi:hypothetical protein EJB05_57864 [Eragrostis curvula]|uniref:Uncharacterized protein n=1 Tax=Eragrostis curvula TaxID=38414 RepID=A0A5J9SDI9_9POAL|nr:hypothetical protein EJB05_57864 [Eragrostis curvula]
MIITTDAAAGLISGGRRRSSSTSAAISSHQRLVCYPCEAPRTIRLLFGANGGYGRQVGEDDDEGEPIPALCWAPGP